MDNTFSDTATFGLAYLLFLGLAAAFGVYIARNKSLTARRLLAGYLGALGALAALVALYSYVPRSKAVSLWQIAPHDYWHELIRVFLTTFAMASSFTVLGMSVIGMPALNYLSRLHRATAPWLIACSVAISTLAAVWVKFMPGYPIYESFPYIWTTLLLMHCICAAGFAFAARLPWTLTNK
jgi:NAD/NADP transhydrogenase beta subunit